MGEGMMFALRGLAVSLSAFVLVYCLLSIAVLLLWRCLRLHAKRLPARRLAGWLFTLRVFPLVAAATVTGVLTVPSFLLLEPRAIQEPLGGIPVALGIFGAALGIFGIVKAALALRRARGAIAEWACQAQPLKTSVPVPVLRMARSVPAMIAAGIFRPRVLVSGAAEAMLSAAELKGALNHEVAHVRRHDNLKKLLLRFVAFPGMSLLETAWLEATEMAADEAAVANAGEALDLAAALIKLSRLGPTECAVDLTAALVHSRASALNARVERLLAWSDQRHVPRRHTSWFGVFAILAAAVTFVLPYGQLLLRVHTATEWLVR
jgi:beta-lactamase regulating signal transducer with metallopeptidase domain